MGILVCDANTGKELKDVLETKRLRFVSSPALNPAGTMLAMADSTDAVNQLRLPQMKSHTEVENEGYSSASFVLQRPGTRQLVTVKSPRIHIWDLDKRSVSKSLTFPSYISAGDFSKDGRCLALACHSSKERAAAVLIIDAQTWKTVRTLPMKAQSGRGVAFSPDGSRIAGVDVQVAYCWDVKSGKQLWRQGVIAEGNGTLYLLEMTKR